MSLEAHGSIGKILTFSERGSGSQTRKYTKPLKAPSAKQRAQRRLTEFLVAQWQNMTENQKNTWETAAKASDKRLAGYHYFLREAQRDLYTHHGLCGYWSFNEIIGGKVLDLSGNANHGTLKPTYPSNTPTLVNSGITRFNNALDFDGVDDYILCDYAETLNVLDGNTFEFYIKPKVLAETLIINGAYHVGGWDIFLSEGKMQIRHNAADVHQDTWSNVNKIVTDVGVIVTITMNNVTKKDRFYFNGVFDVERTVAFATDPSLSDRNFSIGAWQAGTHPYKGIIDEMCKYNRVLSDAEILARYRFTTTKV